MDNPGQTKNIPPSMHQPYKRLLNANPKARLTVAHFLEQGRRSGGFFETALIRLSDGVDSLDLKSDSEKEELLRYDGSFVRGKKLLTHIVNSTKSRTTFPKISSR